MVPKQVVDEINQYPWFIPKPTLVQENIIKLVKDHEEFLRPFGLKDSFDGSFIKIWPGSTPTEIAEIHKNAKKSVLYMIIENLLGVIREVAVTSRRMPSLDTILREIKCKIKTSIKEAAVQVAGLTVKQTLAMQVVIPQIETMSQETTEITEVEIVDKAVDDALETIGWYISWAMLDDYFSKKKYTNPFTPLIELWKLGVWPVGVYQNHFVILVPGGRRVRIITPTIQKP